MKRDIKDFVNLKRRSKYHTVNNLPGFVDVQNANLFVMYVKARFLIKFEQTKSYVAPIFYLIISSCSMIDLIQLLNLISKSITSPNFLAHYVNCLRLHHQMSSELMEFTVYVLACIHKIGHNS
jgi:hypothetical protein